MMSHDKRRYVTTEDSTYSWLRLTMVRPDQNPFRGRSVPASVSAYLSCKKWSESIDCTDSVSESNPPALSMPDVVVVVVVVVVWIVPALSLPVALVALHVSLSLLVVAMVGVGVMPLLTSPSTSPAPTVGEVAVLSNVASLRKLQSDPATPVGSQHSCQPTVKLHILPLVWNFPLGKG